jgi:hypothetical protein
LELKIELFPNQKGLSRKKNELPGNQKNGFVGDCHFSSTQRFQINGKFLLGNTDAKVGVQERYDFRQVCSNLTTQIDRDFRQSFWRNPSRKGNFLP